MHTSILQTSIPLVDTGLCNPLRLGEVLHSCNTNGTIEFQHAVQFAMWNGEYGSYNAMCAVQSGIVTLHDQVYLYDRVGGQAVLDVSSLYAEVTGPDGYDIRQFMWFDHVDYGFLVLVLTAEGGIEVRREHVVDAISQKSWNEIVPHSWTRYAKNGFLI